MPDNNLRKIKTNSRITRVHELTMYFSLTHTHTHTLFRHRLASGTNEKIQLSSMVAAFQAVRDLVVSEALK